MSDIPRMTTYGPVRGESFHPLAYALEVTETASALDSRLHQYAMPKERRQAFLNTVRDEEERRHRAAWAAVDAIAMDLGTARLVRLAANLSKRLAHEWNLNLALRNRAEWEEERRAEREREDYDMSGWSDYFPTMSDPLADWERELLYGGDHE